MLHLNEEERLILRTLWHKLDDQFFKFMYDDLFRLDPNTKNFFTCVDLGNMLRSGLKRILEGVAEQEQFTELGKMHKSLGIDIIAFKFMRVSLLNAFIYTKEFELKEIDVWLKVFDYAIESMCME